uniref:ACB domain-containing protein n=1 Tax=Ditylenchus dipsaci TaxID=166011 RepID=A0A915CNI4_9BILA
MSTVYCIKFACLGTAGDATGSRPGAFDFAGRAKFDAWKSNEGLSKDEAQKKYAELIESLLKDANVSVGAQHSTNSTPTSGLKICTEGKVFKIQLDPMDNASKDRTTSLTVITGSGEYFCSGNDLSNFTRVKSPEDMIPVAEMEKTSWSALSVLSSFMKNHWWP